VIEVRDLVKRFGKRAVLDGVSFRVREGEAIALCGSNGAGKTTVLRCVLGLQPHEGSIRVNGRDAARDGKAARASIGYVPQELAFQENVPVGETIAFYARLRRAGEAEVRALLHEVGLLDAASRPAGALSGGMKQRLALAIALLGDPPVLLLDEPTSNLDPEGREAFLKRLVALRETGKTILFTSHRGDEVEALADRVLFLDAGKVRAETPGLVLAAVPLRVSDLP
jgi:ABC-2 type transport system ATP-binding protein/nitrous oxidase accessory protein